MKLPRWARAQKKRKEAKRWRLVKTIFLLIGLVLILGIGYRIWGSFSACVWDSKSRLTLALNTEPLLIVSFAPSEKSLTFLSFPGKTYIEAIHGYGFYKTESLWQLGELENNGGEILMGSFQEYLGVPVDAFVSQPGLEIETDRIKESYLRLLQSLFLGEGVTNLTRWDLWRLWWGIRKVRFDKINVLDIQETDAVREVILPDGSEALESDPLCLDRLVNRFFSDQRIRNEDLKVGVFNATGYSGLAKRAARLINNLGGQVVEVGDWPQTEASCLIKGNRQLAKAFLVKKLSQVFHCQYKTEEEGESSVDISLILGEDYWQKLTAR